MIGDVALIDIDSHKFCEVGLRVLVKTTIALLVFPFKYKEHMSLCLLIIYLCVICTTKYIYFVLITLISTQMLEIFMYSKYCCTWCCKTMLSAITAYFSSRQFGETKTCETRTNRKCSCAAYTYGHKFVSLRKVHKSALREPREFTGCDSCQSFRDQFSCFIFTKKTYFCSTYSRVKLISMYNDGCVVCNNYFDDVRIFYFVSFNYLEC